MPGRDTLPQHLIDTQQEKKPYGSLDSWRKAFCKVFDGRVLDASQQQVDDFIERLYINMPFIVSLARSDYIIYDDLTTSIKALNSAIHALHVLSSLAEKYPVLSLESQGLPPFSHFKQSLDSLRNRLELKKTRKTGPKMYVEIQICFAIYDLYLIYFGKKPTARGERPDTLFEAICAAASDFIGIALSQSSCRAAVKKWGTPPVQK